MSRFSQILCGVSFLSSLACSLTISGEKDTAVSCDIDWDGYCEPEDCNEGNEYVNPGVFETCNNRDDDCDGDIDDDGACVDSDGDGVIDEDDCDDDDPEVGGPTTWHHDFDGDGYGQTWESEWTPYDCDPQEGYADNADDCDDTDAAIHPGAEEPECESAEYTVDYNCDGSTGYDDVDSDGVYACDDCNDADAAIYPDATEVCDGIDNDCDGYEDDERFWYPDADADGHGFGSASWACDRPDGYVPNNDDCDDNDAAINPDATEVCDDGADNNCDGVLDEDCAEDTGG